MSITQNGLAFDSNGYLLVSGVAGGAAVSAGTNVVSSGTAVFSNSNGISFGMNTNGVVTASVAGTVAGGGQMNISAGTTSNNISSLAFVNGGGVSFGLNSNSITATVASQTNQSVGAYAVSNTTQGTSGTLDARSLSFNGAGGVSVGYSNGSIVISGATGGAGGAGVSAGTQSVSTGTVVYSNSNNITFGMSGSSRVTASYAFNVSAGTTSNNLNSLSFSNGSGVSFGLNAGTVTASVAAQTNQTVGAYAVSNTTQNSSTTLDARSLSFQGAGAVSVGYSNGSVVISAAAGAQSVQTIGLYGSSQTTGQSSSSTVDARSLTMVGAGMISVGMSGGSFVVSSPATTDLPQISIGQSTGGNTSGNTGMVTGQMVLAGGNNITLSGSTNAGSMTISVIGGAGAGGGAAISAGTQSVSTGTVAFSNSNNVTFGMSGSNVVTASVSQSLGFYAIGNTTQNSSTTLAAGTLSYNALGAMTMGYSNGSIQVSAPATSSLSATGIVSLSVNGSTISIGASQSAQTVGAYAVSNTTQSSSGTLDARSLSFQGAGGVSVGYSNGSVVISGGAVGGGGAAISAGTQSVSTGTVVYSNSNNITFGMSGSSRVTASYAFNISAGTTSNNLNSISFSNGSNVSFGLNAGTLTASVATSLTAVNISAGTTSNNVSQLSFSNGSGVSFGINSNTITASVAAQTNQSVGLYALGNTTQNSSTTLDARTLSYNALGAMTMGYSNGSIQVSAPATSSLSATGMVSISANGSTISIGVPGGTASRYDHLKFQAESISSSGQTNGSYSVQYVQVPTLVSFSRMDLPVILSLSSSGATNTAAIAVSAMAVIYTKNGSTLNPLVGASNSQTFSWASNTASFSNLTGPRMFSFGLGTYLTPGDYWVGVHLSTTSGISTGANTTALNGTFSQLIASCYTASNFADFNSATASTTNNVLMGMLSSVPTATNQTLQLSQLSMSGANLARANIPLVFRNY